MLTAFRFTVLGLGLVAGPLLVRALEEGFAAAPRSLSVGHLALGVVVAAVAQPGPILGVFVTPESGERARGLAVGGAVVTALAALFAGALLYRSLFVLHEGNFAAGITFVWAVAALPLAAVDFLRLRG